MVEHMGVDVRASMPSGLSYVLRAHPLLTMLSKSVLAPVVLFGMSWFRGSRMQAAPSVYFPVLRYALIGWVVCALLWAVARLGPSLGIGADGIWFRAGLWRRKVRFVPWSRLSGVEVDPREMGPRGFVCGVRLRLVTTEGPVGRVARFVPCDEERVERLLDVLADHGVRVRELRREPKPKPKHVVAWIFGTAAAILVIAVVAVVWSELR